MIEQFFDSFSIVKHANIDDRKPCDERRTALRILVKDGLQEIERYAARRERGLVVEFQASDRIDVMVGFQAGDDLDDALLCFESVVFIELR